MKYFFMFLGACGALMMIAVAAALFVGAPFHQKEVIKKIEIRRQ
jgi:hypothetical protein